jgi:hypothetical protein
LFVLDMHKAAMEGAPQVKSGQFAAHGQFDPESQKAGAYWKARLADNRSIDPVAEPNFRRQPTLWLDT